MEVIDGVTPSLVSRQPPGSPAFRAKSQQGRADTTARKDSLRIATCAAGACGQAGSAFIVAHLNALRLTGKDADEK